MNHTSVTILHDLIVFGHKILQTCEFVSYINGLSKIIYVYIYTTQKQLQIHLKRKRKMFTEEKKKNTNYGSIFVSCFFCLVLVVGVVRCAKPYYNLQNLMETEAVMEQGLLDVGILPCNLKSSVSVPARNHQKLSTTVREETRTRPPNSYCVKFESFATMSKLVAGNGDKYESRPFSAGGYNWYVHTALI